ncbi:vacuolar protein sorting-associated [Fimicolochytrium jonesii]|uniref:vacuolar protein sorting-associated n=1 Tax=Fimicolochytrium jonesii TaxID=1396493 RepID=UPI0022FF2625|nr:vacuolar protein sorting-associated [Fimicolochytrium jonesii]KAI8816405.1 vacuolar protein sorting-associated [Fimicolochytrium jonesii]
MYSSTASSSATPMAGHDPILDHEIRLYTNNKEREKYDNMADLYGIIVATEHLERAYIRDAISAQEYTPACLKLIAQYKTALNLVGDWVPDVNAFIKEYQLSCPAATRRLLEIGVPATIEHATTDTTGSAGSAKFVAETVQSFITLMDSLKLNYVAVDQIHPQLSDLIQSLNKVPSLPKDYEGKGKIRDWLITLNKMKASEEIDADQVRQLLFDLESALTEFHRSLSK